MEISRVLFIVVYQPNGSNSQSGELVADIVSDIYIHWNKPDADIMVLGDFNTELQIPVVPSSAFTI